jgi:hypothetical protein
MEEAFQDPNEKVKTFVRTFPDEKTFVRTFGGKAEG